jgi:endonuclease YncB( thermonuclease family)
MFVLKKISISFVVILFFLAGIGIGFGLGEKYAAPVGQDVQSENENKNRETSGGENPDFVGEFSVNRVIDGDTLEIAGGEKVRYIGIDTPEIVDSRKPVQCFGKEASDKNKELVAGKIVRLERDTTDRDRYNRLLRYVYVGDSFINLELVKQGFARSYSYPPDIKYQDQILKAEQEAKKTKIGLWLACL